MPTKKEKTAAVQAPPSAKSTAKASAPKEADAKMKPSLVEPLRFSARREKKKEGGAIGRIIIYVVIVILVGVGLSLLVQSYISTQTATEEETEPTIIETSDLGSNPTVASAVIGDEILEDSAAGTIKDNEDYTENSLSLGSVANDTTDVNISMLTHEVYTSFTRTMWEMSNVTTGLPATTIIYNKISNEIVVTFEGIGVVEQELLQMFSTEVGNVTSITGSETEDGLEFVLILETTSKYTAYVDGGDTLVVETKTEAQLTEPTPEEVVEEETTPEADEAEEEVTPEADETEDQTVADEGAPASPHFDNEFSQQKQYVVNDDATANTVNFDTYYYQDDATSFLFSWAMRTTGTDSIPNATAELITDSGVDYIEITINNLARDLLNDVNKDEATIVISTAGTPLERVIRKSTSDGTSVYWVELSEKTDFKLHSTLTEGTYQLLTIEVSD